MKIFIRNTSDMHVVTFFSIKIFIKNTSGQHFVYFIVHIKVVKLPKVMV